jgi:hypothetical protein
MRLATCRCKRIISSMTRFPKSRPAGALGNGWRLKHTCRSRSAHSRFRNRRRSRLTITEAFHPPGCDDRTGQRAFLTTNRSISMRRSRWLFLRTSSSSSVRIPRVMWSWTIAVRELNLRRRASKLSVRDFGPGLEPKSVDRLFEAFYTTKPDGLGMGLAICRSIIGAHGGRLWATANGAPSFSSSSP